MRDDTIDVDPPEECNGCGNKHPKRIKICLNCGNTKCDSCDMGDDVECPSCLNDFLGEEEND